MAEKDDVSKVGGKEGGTRVSVKRKENERKAEENGWREMENV